MRTTVELKDKHRAKLLELAARRGQKGFSDLLAEAIDVYLETLSREDDLREIALGVEQALNRWRKRSFAAGLNLRLWHLA